jgi:hypothetical protein
MMDGEWITPESAFNLKVLLKMLIEAGEKI